MFKLHETTRKRLCRAAFFALALVPTAAVLAWGVSRHLPGHAQACVDQLSSALGLEIRAASVSHPRPGVLLLADVTAADPETGLAIVHCGSLELLDRDEQVTAAASLVEIEAARADVLWRALDRHLRRSPKEICRLTFTADPMTWKSAAGNQSFADVLARLGPSVQGTEVEINFRLADAKGDEPAQVRITRHRTPAPNTGVTIRSGGTPLPCSVFSPLVDTAGWLGARARFNGYLWLRDLPDGWQGELTGNLTELDLDALVTGRFPHVMRGLADLRVERAKFSGGRISEAAGALRGGAGEISASLLAAGQQQLQLVGSEELADAARIEAYDRLAVDFILDAAGLSLLGGCGPTGALLVQSGEALWKQPAHQPQPAVALVRMLVPASQVQVPAAGETDLLLRHLPLAPIQPPAAADGSPIPPHARLRIGN